MDPHRDDPFSALDGERTLIKPAAGRPRPDVRAAGGAAPPRPAGGAPLPLDALMSASLNPLVSAAAALLAAAPRLRRMPHHPDPEALKQALAEGVRKFEAQARAQGLPQEQVIAGRYVLCTLLDESAASTPWGGQGGWSAHSLLVQFHNETWGGEKVFQLMARLAENVPAHRNLLELLYIAVALGYEGRFRVLDNGRAELDGVRRRLAQLLRQGQPAPDRALSPRWQGEAASAGRLRDGLPLWALAAFAALLLAGVLTVLRLQLAERFAPAFAVLAALDVRAPAAPPAPAPVPAAAPRLAGFLEPEIAAGLVRVQDFNDRSVVTIMGDAFFEAGSAAIAPAVRSLLPRLGRALAERPGQVLVTGHTDSRPIHTLRYPSNWQLSQDRAQAVLAALAPLVAPERLRAEGRADTAPAADNGTPDGRARNRRVEITLFVRQPDAAR